MSRLLSRVFASAGSAALLLLSGGGAAPQAVSLVPVPLAIEAPDVPSSTSSPDCVTPGSPYGNHTYPQFHCYAPADIAAAYHLDQFRAAHAGDPAALGQGSTIVLVDSYGSPTAQNDIDFFASSFGMPTPNFDEIYYSNQTGLTFKNTYSGNGQSGPAAAAGWSVEATLDIEWAYAIAPLAHIVLLGTNPAETEGVQGLPAMFKAMKLAVDKYGPNTIFSQSFGLTEQTFGGAAGVQTASFDQTYKYGIAHGDTFVASSGDEGSGGVDKQHRDSGTYNTPVIGYPASSPYNVAVGGTDLMYNWLWAPTTSSPTSPLSQDNNFFNSTPCSGVCAEPLWAEGWLGAGNNTTGGGKSSLYASPSWQSQQSSLTGGMRGIPDLSWNAAINGGVLIYLTSFSNAIRPGWHLEGGTSASSPQVAGLFAVVDAMRAEQGKSPIGDPHAAIYALGNGSTASTYYRDVTAQHFGSANYPLVDNQWTTNTPNVPGWPATSGWDMTTGFGSPLTDQWLPAIIDS